MESPPWKSRNSSFSKEQPAPPATVYQQDLSTWKTTTITVQSIDSGLLNGKRAWLVCLTLQFSCPHNDRFKKANIMLQFEPTDPGLTNIAIVKRWAPQFLTGRRTTSSVEWTFEGSLTAGVDMPGSTVKAGASLSRTESTVKEHSCSILSDTWKSPQLVEPNAVRFYIHENEQSRGGIPNRLNAVLVIQSDVACRGRATVETNGIKAMYARGHHNPIELQVDASYEPRFPEAMKDFATLNTAEWQMLATPTLQMSDNIVGYDR
ncbi:hypothetical protein SLS60_009277 [Paraconiothyrium brasiliense]|uniref:Uncharacterized protein n=1 Tax=Paraconiothyrium brasiliense TaxID=300254 RepID=A0ABR3QWU7_9PLEO